MTRDSQYSTTVLDATLPRDREGNTLDQGARFGRYLIIKELGRGGMGVVYAAHDEQLDRQVALKLLHPTSTGEDAERLVREAQALARLSDPHVVSVYDAGEIEGRVFIAMQLVHGEDLATAIKRRPSPAQALGWFVQAALGLAASHDAGLVHRDFKPSNVLLDHRGHVAVTDFGLARPQGDIDARAVMMGTPAYMAPEQHGLQPATPASDQFAFCVSLWEALFGEHPYIREDRGAMSPFAIGYAICSRSLDVPTRARSQRRRIPRRAIDALVRGLARDPAVRWPSMRELIEELTPAPRLRAAPIAAAAGATLAIALTAGAYAWTQADRRAAPSCEAGAAVRLATGWSPAAGVSLEDRFARAGYPATTRGARAGLDRFATRWTQLAGDLCVAERIAAPVGQPELVVRKRACLDARLDALRSTVALLTGDQSARFVEHAQAMIDELPDLGECADADALLAAAAPPAALAPEVSRIDREIVTAIAVATGGDNRGAEALLRPLVAAADRLGWAPTRARARIALGARLLGLIEPARAELVTGAQLATEARLDRDAARGWAFAGQAAGTEHARAALDAFAAIARGTAARTHDRLVAIEVDLALARGLVRSGAWRDGAAACRAAAAAADTVDSAYLHDEGRGCQIEALVSLGAYNELEPMLTAAIAETTAHVGSEHPRISDYLGIEVTIDLRRGQLARARAAAERSLAIRQRAYPATHHQIADALHTLADVTLAEGKREDALALYERALALTDEARPEELVMISGLHISIAMIQDELGKHADAVAHFERGVRLVRERSGNDSVELAILLLNFGQSRSRDDVDAGLKLVGEARGILDRAHDPRAVIAGVVLVIVQDQGHYWHDVVTTGEAVLAQLGPDAYPEEVASLKWVLAKGILETHGDRARARGLAREARQLLVGLGPSKAGLLREIDHWLASR